MVWIKIFFVQCAKDFGCMGIRLCRFSIYYYTTNLKYILYRGMHFCILLIFANKELYDHGMYVISAHGGYPSGVLNDNSGTSTGGMLQFDLLDPPSGGGVVGPQDDFFEIDVDNICTGKEITFGADFASMSEWPGCVEVTLEYNGKVLESDSSSKNCSH